MQAIVTKYHGPTNFRGSRIVATAQAGRASLSWDSAANHDDNHRAAALALCRKMGWAGKWYEGGLPDGRTVFVCATWPTGIPTEPAFTLSDGRIELVNA